MMLLKMEWFGTMFPRIPVGVQKDIHDQVKPDLAKLVMRNFCILHAL